MPYLIDGHNLIPKLGLRLDSLDDEVELVEWLNTYCRLSRKTGLEVYFDNAAPASPTTRRMGLVTAHFVRKPLIADTAIRLRLKKLGKAARNWTVVSSDHAIQADARAVGARSISSDEFAETVMQVLRTGPGPSQPENDMSARELYEWIKFFDRDRNDFSKF